VEDQRGKVWGSALYSSTSQIALRMVAQNAVEAEKYPELLRYRIRQAIAYRERVVRDADAFRVLFSEADITPGLIVDKYNDVISVQAQTQAMDAAFAREILLEELKAAYKPETILERVDPRIRELEGLPAREDQVLYSRLKKAKTSTEFHINGLAFHYDGSAGQKTGAFLDQRENYRAAERYAHGRALEICTYQGGFALHMNRVCEQVTAVDISADALAVADGDGDVGRGDIGEAGVGDDDVVLADAKVRDFVVSGVLGGGGRDDARRDIGDGDGGVGDDCAGAIVDSADDASVFKLRHSSHGQKKAEEGQETERECTHEREVSGNV